MWWFTTCTLFLYVCLICAYSLSWYKIKSIPIVPTLAPAPLVSVVVAVRNEENNVLALVKQLLTQDYPNFELIIVDDHSTDQSLNLLSSISDTRLKILSAEGSGKKAAIRQAVLFATSNSICSFDADCSLGTSCISSLMNHFIQEKADLLIGPVCMSSENSLQALEFLSLSGTAGASANLGRPVLCNGANLSFTKKAYLLSLDELHQDEASGDDMFLLSSVKRRKGKISYVKDADAVVTVAAQSSFRGFFQQRARWVSKSKSYTDYHVIGVGLLVLLVQILILFSYFLIPFNAHWSIFIVAKVLVDALLLFQVAAFFQQRRLFVWFPLLSIIYPLYVLFSVLLSFGAIQWKGRKI